MTRTLARLASLSVAVPALFLAACATTAPARPTASSEQAVVDRAFPKLRAPARLQDDGFVDCRVQRSGKVVADVRLCVAPDGTVSDVALSRSSGLDAYDRAVIASASDWSYEPHAGTADRCKDMAIAYDAP